MKSLSRVRLFATPWTVAHQAPPSMGFLWPRILECVAMPAPPGDLPNPGIESRSSALQVDSLPAEPQEKPQNTGVGSLSLLQGIFPDLPNPGIKPGSPALQVDSLLTELSGKPQIREVVYWSANCEICSLWYMEKIKDFNQAVN